MGRFDDQWFGRLLKFLIAPAISAGVMWIAFRVEVEHRITTVEIKTDVLVSDVKDIRTDVKTLLMRVK